MEEDSLEYANRILVHKITLVHTTLYADVHNINEGFNELIHHYQLLSFKGFQTKCMVSKIYHKSPYSCTICTIQYLVHDSIQHFCILNYH